MSSTIVKKIFNRTSSGSTKMTWTKMCRETHFSGTWVMNVNAKNNNISLRYMEENQNLASYVPFHKERKKIGRSVDFHHFYIL